MEQFAHLIAELDSIDRQIHMAYVIMSIGVLGVFLVVVTALLSSSTPQEDRSHPLEDKQSAASDTRVEPSRAYFYLFSAVFLLGIGVFGNAEYKLGRTVSGEDVTLGCIQHALDETISPNDRNYIISKCATVAHLVGNTSADAYEFIQQCPIAIVNLYTGEKSPGSLSPKEAGHRLYELCAAVAHQSKTQKTFHHLVCQVSENAATLTLTPGAIIMNVRYCGSRDLLRYAVNNGEPRLEAMIRSLE